MKTNPLNPEGVTRYLTTTEVAELLRSSERTIRRLCEEGALDSFRVGKRKLLIPWQSVGSYIRRGIETMAGAVDE
jgi:excisionase family DNA binding protein